jgi:hypothetical protein
VKVENSTSCSRLRPAWPAFGGDFLVAEDLDPVAEGQLVMMVAPLVALQEQVEEQLAASNGTKPCSSTTNSATFYSAAAGG